jgi:hypothetical protein
MMGRDMPGMLRVHLLGSLIFALSLSALRLASAQDDASASAAAHFDAGVQAYKQADYARAAEAFLTADSQLPSVSALSNALAAARRAGLPLLIARAAERMLSRPQTSEADRKGAESALAEQSAKLARLELSCEGSCEPQIDGIPQAIYGSYVLPGEHRIAASGYLEQSVRCEVGVPCRVLLSPIANAPAPAEVARALSEAQVERAERAGPGPEAVRSDAPDRRKKNRLALGVFASSGAGALVLLSLATWQGVEALHAKRDYEPASEKHPWNDATRAAHRSDGLLAGGVVLAGVALASAIWWVDWGAYGSTQLSLAPGGATLTTRRRF